MAEFQSQPFLEDLEVPVDEFAVFGLVYAHPEHADALEEVYAQTTKLAASEPGTIYYCICRDPDDRNCFHFFERYTGKAAFEAHNNQPVIQKLMKDGLMRGVKAKFVKAVEPK